MKNILHRAWLFALPAFLFTAFDAAAATGVALVRKVEGTAIFSGPNGSGPLKSGMAILQGTRLTTGAGSYVDLFLDTNGGVLRLEENSAMQITELTFRNFAGNETFNTDLEVSRGHVVANVVKKLNRSSRYNIRTPVGVAGIRGTTLRTGSTGVQTLVGTVSFTFANGQLQLVIGGQVLPAGAAASQPMTRVQTTGLANVATTSTVNSGIAADLVRQTVQTFVTAIAAEAASGAETQGGNAGAAAADAAQLVMADLLAAVQTAANSAPPEVRAAAQAAAQQLAAQQQTVKATAAANGAAIGVVSAGGGATKAAQAANTAANNATTDAGARAAAAASGGKTANVAATQKAGGASLAQIVDSPAVQQAGSPPPPPPPPGQQPPPPNPTTTTTTVIKEQEHRSGQSPF